MILAEASNGFMGALIYALIALIGGVAAAFGIYFGFREPKKQRTTIENQPVEVRKAPKRFNHELAESRYSELKQADVNLHGRLDDHDAEINSIWAEMRKEDGDTRKQIQEASERNAERFENIAKSLGRIEGAMGTKPTQS